MPLVRDAFEYYRKAMKDGKADMRTGHPYIAEEQAVKRERNPDNKTKISWDSADADSYREWHKERARWMKAADKNPTTATDMMIVALKAYSEEAMRIIKDSINETRVASSGE